MIPQIDHLKIGKRHQDAMCQIFHKIHGSACFCSPVPIVVPFSEVPQSGMTPINSIPNSRPLAPLTIRIWLFSSGVGAGLAPASSIVVRSASSSVGFGCSAAFSSLLSSSSANSFCNFCSASSISRCTSEANLVNSEWAKLQLELCYLVEWRERFFLNWHFYFIEQHAGKGQSKSRYFLPLYKCTSGEEAVNGPIGPWPNSARFAQM